MDEKQNITKPKKIDVTTNGPYKVQGNIPLVRKIQIVSEYGEPLAWKLEGGIETREPYILCRCGQSSTWPLCDGTHIKTRFDGTENASTDTFEERKVVYAHGTHIVVKYDDSLCMDSGFCRNRLRGIEEMMVDSDDPEVRELIMAMIERCPSGAYSYAIEKDEPDIEPDYPAQIAVTTEITSEGAIRGPLWVTGNIAINRSDGKPLETRNRVTLCSCGHSKIKPLCDGIHRDLEEQELRKKHSK